MSNDAFHGPRVTGPHRSEIDGACACCRRYDTPDGTTPHEVFGVRAWATTRLCRLCLDDLAREIRAVLATETTTR